MSRCSNIGPWSVTIYGNPKNNRWKKYETQSIAHQPIHLRQPCELTVCNVFGRVHYQPVTNTRIESFFPGSEHLKNRRTERDTVCYWSVLCFFVFFQIYFSAVCENEEEKKWWAKPSNSSSMKGFSKKKNYSFLFHLLLNFLQMYIY